jgi:crossover junction endodeoxyribonuclease RusA
MSVVHIAVNGIDPAPQGSKRHVGHGRMVEASKRVKPWRNAVAASAQQQMREQKFDLITGACSVSVVFRFKRPKSHFTTNGQLKANAPEHCIVKRNDIDKCCRSTLDALSDGGVFADDCLVVSLVADKRYCVGAEPPGALITVTELQHGHSGV